MQAIAIINYKYFKLYIKNQECNKNIIRDSLLAECVTDIERARFLGACAPSLR